MLLFCYDCPSPTGRNQSQACGERNRLLGPRVLLTRARLRGPPGARAAPVRRQQDCARIEGAAVRVAGPQTPRRIVLPQVGEGITPEGQKDLILWRPIKGGKLQQHGVASKVGKCKFVYTAASALYFTIFAS